jgi:hypothetical protein
MTAIAVMIFVLLGAVAAVHISWAFGSTWPAEDERALVALAVGHKSATRMPPQQKCLAAALGIFAAGLIAPAVAGLIPMPLPAIVVTALGIAAAAVFALRGLAAYLPAWRQRFSQQPFATMDRLAYGPLCLLLAAGYSALVLHRIGT